jgi:TPR repeat protein
MCSKRIFVCISAMTALLLSTPAAVAASRSYERGLEATSNYRYSEALMHFQAAAEQGERSAQRTLGLMLLYGERLYGPDIHRNHEQAKRWLQAAAASGCEVSAFMLKAMALQGQ